MDSQPAKLKLLDHVRDRIRLKHYSRRTEDVYLDWADILCSATIKRIRKRWAKTGHKDVQTTIIYTHVLNKGGRGVTLPLDRI